MTCDANTRMELRPVVMLQLIVMLDNWVNDMPYVINKTENTRKAEAIKLSVLEFRQTKHWPDTQQQYTFLNKFWFWC